MSTINATISCECDECGKSVVKIWRNYHGHRYCSTCYNREFKHRCCPQCGKTSKLPRKNINAICINCETNKPCIRCKKTFFNTALISEYGPVCGSCAPYFRKKEPCEICGTPSGRLTRISRFEHDKKMCQKCARSDYRTCQSCARHRLLQPNADGKLLCKICHIIGNKECVTCKISMPAGYGNRCETCYWKGLYEHRCHLNHSALSSQKIRPLFELYTKWLCQTCGYHKAAIILNRHMSFFLSIDKKWGTLPKFDELLTHFGTPLLRKNFLPLRWLIEEKYVKFDPRLKKDHAEWTKIKKKT